jgi:hypothetical protein
LRTSRHPNPPAGGPRCLLVGLDVEIGDPSLQLVRIPKLTGFVRSDRLLWGKAEEVIIFILAGAAGLLIGLVLLLIFLYRRILFVARKLGGKPASVPKPLESLRNLLLIFLWTSVFGMLLFAGFFFRAYRAFTLEKPVAEIIITHPDESRVSSIAIIQAAEIRCRGRPMGSRRRHPEMAQLAEFPGPAYTVPFDPAEKPLSPDLGRDDEAEHDLLPRRERG